MEWREDVFNEMGVLHQEYKQSLSRLLEEQVKLGQKIEFQQGRVDGARKACNLLSASDGGSNLSTKDVIAKLREEIAVNAERRNFVARGYVSSLRTALAVLEDNPSEEV